MGDRWLGVVSGWAAKERGGGTGLERAMWYVLSSSGLEPIESPPPCFDLAAVDDISEVRVASILREVDEDNNGQIEVRVERRWTCCPPHRSWISQSGRSTSC